MNEEFFDLPENVRQAVTNAKMSQKHSDFYYKLKDLNSKIGTYKNVFYNRIPTHERVFIARKLREAEAEELKM